MGEKLRIFAIVATAILLRWCVSYHPYSGQGKPSMYGDYEAQRHWQEITVNLPARLWYTNGSDNDLQYWGLDYPPLTAYHSLLMGKVAQKMDPNYVELHKSRGYESSEHKHFMRLSVILVDILIYISAMVFYVWGSVILESTNEQADENLFGLRRRHFVLTTALIYPGIILIDHGHFQYNCVSLGFFVASVASILQNRTIVGSFIFVLALNYKQMELYHALPFFFYILGNNTPSKRKTLLSCIRTLICVSLTVIISFIAIWAPFATDWNVFSDAVSRLFPLNRGVFEDKVANFWCALNVFYKFREYFDNAQMARVCLAITTISTLPSCINLYLKPNKERFIVSLINCSLGFYLFSFQVHEKSILLVAIPVVMYFHRDPLPCFWFLVISNLSILPLLMKDRLVLAYFSLNAFYAINVCLVWSREFVNFAVRQRENFGRVARTKTHREIAMTQRKFRIKQNGRSRFVDSRGSIHRYYEKLQNFLGKDYLASRSLLIVYYAKISSFYVSVIGAIVLSIASNVLDPPPKYPDLFPLLIAMYSCLHFIGFFIYFNWKQIHAMHKHSGKSKSH